MFQYTQPMATKKNDMPMKRVRVPRGKSPRGAGSVDRQWIQAELERIYGVGWNRKGAKDMGVDPSDLTRLTRGQRRWTGEYIARLQNILRRPLDEIQRRVGITTPLAPTPEHVKLVGTVDYRGRIEAGVNGLRHVPAPPGIIDSFALIVKAPMAAMDGWVLYYDPRPENPATLVGRVAVIKIEGQTDPVLGVLRRGTQPGHYSVLGFVGSVSVTDAEIVVLEASPIVWVKTG